jgi:DNA-binding response OmpR family regulator
MINALLVNPEKNIFLEIEKGFSDHGIGHEWADSADKALSMLSDKNFDLVIFAEQIPDIDPRKFIENILSKNAMINCVVLSPLSHKDFHEKYEGLGVLMQFPQKPERSHVTRLVDQLKKIAGIAAKAQEL